MFNKERTLWYRRKNFYVITPVIEDKTIFYSSKNLKDFIKQNFLQITDFYKFLWKIYEL